MNDEPDVPQHVRDADRANGEPGATDEDQAAPATQRDEHGEPVPPMTGRPGPLTEDDVEQEERQGGDR